MANHRSLSYLLAWLIVFLTIRPTGIYTLVSVGDLPMMLAIPFLVKYFAIYRKYFLYILVMVVYLFLVDLLNTGFGRPVSSLGALRHWVYFLMALCSGVIFAKLLPPTFSLYRKTLLYGIVLWVAVLAGVLTGMPGFEDIFLGASDSETRMAVPGPYFIFFCIVVMAFARVSKADYFGIAVMLVVLVAYYYLSESRQFLMAFLVLFVCLLYRFMSLWRFVFLITGLSFGLFFLAVSDFSVAGRLEELLYFYNSVSFWVRMNEAEMFISAVMDGFWSMWFGKGLTFSMDVPRYVLDDSFDLKSGGDVFGEQVGIYIPFHSADNLVSLLMVDGGIVLLVFFLFVFVASAHQVFRSSRAFGAAFVALAVVISIGSVHLITNCVWGFVMSYMYFHCVRLYERKT